VSSSCHMVLALCVAAAIQFLLCCTTADAAEPDGLVATVNRTETIRRAIQNRLAEKTSRIGLSREESAVIDYYSKPGARVLWVNESGLLPRAKSVIREVEKADAYGLRPADYELPKPDEFEVDNSASWLADAEIKINIAILSYARDARGGRIDPLRLSNNLDITLELPDPNEVLKSISISSQPAADLRTFHPDHPQFEALRQKLIKLRSETINSSKTNVKIPKGPILKLGVEHEQVVLLRKRLNMPSTIENGGSSNDMMFDAAMLAAVKQFQAAHGVPDDGMVGPGTRRLLNEENQESAFRARVRLIILNMERWRWLPRNLGSFYVMVNVPNFQLQVIGDGKPVFTAPVIVGAPRTQTPILSNEIQEIVFNPYWNVPNSIKIDELLPYMRGGTDSFGRRRWNTLVLRRNNLRVSIEGREVDPTRLDWDRIDIRNLNIYQPPGPDNVLGNLKLVFPNKHDVYMHDTPLKFLFARPARAESHGCVRVQNTDRLALVLLKRDQGWTNAEVSSAISKGYDQHVELKQKIPVHITYFTLRVNGDGSISRFDDLYGHDARMAAVLFGESATSAPRSKAAGSGISRKPDRNRARRNLNAITESSPGFMSNF
jgi:murein L,D-transpeptidase YcbB/YkuD